MCEFVSVRLKSATGMYTERNLTVQISKQTFAKQPLEIYVEWLRLERKFLTFEPHLRGNILSRIYLFSCFEKPVFLGSFCCCLHRNESDGFTFLLLKAAILKSCHSFFVVLVFTSCLTSICLCPDANLIFPVLRKKFDRKLNYSSEI